MKNKDFGKAQGHWTLALMGKRVLSPGGKELTLKLVELLNISFVDEIVEFAPGIGFTASLALSHNPNSNTGVEAEEDIVKLLKEKFTGKNVTILRRNASDTSMLDNNKDKIIGEATLTYE